MAAALMCYPAEPGKVPEHPRLVPSSMSLLLLQHLPEEAEEAAVVGTDSNEELDDLEDILSQPQPSARPRAPNPWEDTPEVLFLLDRPWEEHEKEASELWLENLKRGSVGFGKHLMNPVAGGAMVAAASVGAAAGAVVAGPAGAIYGAGLGAKGGAALVLAGSALIAKKEVDHNHPYPPGMEASSNEERRDIKGCPQAEKAGATGGVRAAGLPWWAWHHSHRLEDGFSGSQGASATASPPPAAAASIASPPDDQEGHKKPLMDMPGNSTAAPAGKGDSGPAKPAVWWPWQQPTEAASAEGAQGKGEGEGGAHLSEGPSVNCGSGTCHPLERRASDPGPAQSLREDPTTELPAGCHATSAPSRSQPSAWWPWSQPAASVCLCGAGEHTVEALERAVTLKLTVVSCSGSTSAQEAGSVTEDIGRVVAELMVVMAEQGGRRPASQPASTRISSGAPGSLDPPHQWWQWQRRPTEPSAPAALESLAATPASNSAATGSGGEAEKPTPGGRDPFSGKGPTTAAVTWFPMLWPSQECPIKTADGNATSVSCTAAGTEKEPSLPPADPFLGRSLSHSDHIVQRPRHASAANYWRLDGSRIVFAGFWEAAVSSDEGANALGEGGEPKASWPSIPSASSSFHMELGRHRNVATATPRADEPLLPQGANFGAIDPSASKAPPMAVHPSQEVATAAAVAATQGCFNSCGGPEGSQGSSPANRWSIWPRSLFSSAGPQALPCTPSPLPAAAVGGLGKVPGNNAAEAVTEGSREIVDAPNDEPHGGTRLPDRIWGRVSSMFGAAERPPAHQRHLQTLPASSCFSSSAAAGVSSTPWYSVFLPTKAVSSSSTGSTGKAGDKPSSGSGHMQTGLPFVRTAPPADEELLGEAVDAMVEELLDEAAAHSH
mmetsp:Transcript_33197/g.94031  ORF Transcript_33197/g.94031 Transcript_33197/m.94031 type:complete len:893 (+) Transcript_33197:365-3043(+)